MFLRKTLYLANEPFMQECPQMERIESTKLAEQTTAELTQRCHECCQYLSGCNIIVINPIELQQLIQQLEPHNKRSDIAQIQREFQVLLDMRDTGKKISFSSTKMYSWSPEHWQSRTADIQQNMAALLKPFSKPD